MLYFVLFFVQRPLEDSFQTHKPKVSLGIPLQADQSHPIAPQDAAMCVT